MSSKKAVDISGICTNCGNRKGCDFVRGIKSYMRYHRNTDCINDIEISIYSCKEYDPEKSKESCNNNICLSCIKEE